MPSRQSSQHTDSDAAGRARYTDFDASRDRIRQRLALAHPVGPSYRVFNRRWIYAAAALLLFCFIGSHLFQPPAYAQLADDFRVRIATDELSSTRAGNRPAEESSVASALSFYHQGKYDQAAVAFSSLAQQKNEPKQELYIFYQGASEWLNRTPVAAITTLEPLLQETMPSDLWYRTISYVLAMAYVDNEAFSKAIPLLTKLAEKKDGKGRRATQMLAILSNEGIK